MRYYLKKIVWLFVLMVGVAPAIAQDTHFSQFDAAPLYYNPALAGVNECHNRIYTNYKGQWRTYNTFLMSYDQHLEKVQLFGGSIGLGALVVADYSGENSYGTTQFKLMPAYHYNMGRLRISAGLDAAFNLMSINEDKLVVGKNINPLTGEYTTGSELENTTRFYFDMGVGLNGQYFITNKFPINMGITLFRLFGYGGGGLAVASQDSKENYRRFSMNANAVCPVTPKVTLLPSLIYINQKMYNEMNFGSYVKCAVGEYTPVIDAIYIGSWYRVQDALILGLAFDKPINKNWTLQFGFSYDITLSSYREANKWATSKNVGGDSFEFSLKLLNCRLPILVNPEGIVNDPFR